MGREVVAGEERCNLARLAQQREPALYLPCIALLAHVLHYVRGELGRNIHMAS